MSTARKRGRDNPNSRPVPAVKQRRSSPGALLSQLAYRVRIVTKDDNEAAFQCSHQTEARQAGSNYLSKRSRNSSRPNTSRVSGP